jgi:ribonuclease Z
MLLLNVYNFHPESVFVTHCHADHSFRLTHFVSRSKPPNFFMPISMTTLAESFLFSSQQLSNGSIMNSDDYDINHRTCGVTGGQTLERFCKNKDLCVHVIDCHHAHTPSVGYAFYLKYRKLASHLDGVDKTTIAKMAKNGEVVSEEKELPLFLFLGDTTPEVFNPSTPHSAHQYLQQGWKLVFVECTFISDDEVDNAMRTGHTHWKHLKPIVENYSEVTFVLIHFSRRYRKQEIEEFFLQENVTNIRLFIASEEKLTTGETVEEVSDIMFERR